MIKYDLFLAPIHADAYRHKIKKRGNEYEVMGVITGLFNVNLIEQTNNKEVIKCGDDLIKVILPTMKAYVRNGNAIVTLVRRRKKCI